MVTQPAFRRKRHGRGLAAGFLGLLLLLPLPVWAAPMQCKLLPDLFQNYFQFHYAQKALTEDIKTRTVDQFVKRLDPSKTLFLAKDVDQLKLDLRATFDTMKKGDCSLLDDVRKLSIERAKENETFVRGFLDKNYKIDKTASLLLDPAKRPVPQAKGEKENVLRSLVHFQMENYVLSATKMPEAKKLLIHRYELVAKRVQEKDHDDFVADFVEAFANALDPHSDYMAWDNLKDFQIQMQLSLEGIGATLTSNDGFTIIESLIPGGGAERSQKLRPKDKIVAVAQENEEPVSVIDMDLSDVVKMIRGKKGTKVTLTILRQTEDNRSFEVAIVRDKIDVKDQAASITYDTRQVAGRTIKIGVIDLPSFYGGGDANARSSYTDLKRLLEEAKSKKVDGIVLDLSRNGGGLLDLAVKISGLFLHEGAVVATKDSRGRVQVLSDEDDAVVYSGPLVVLVSRLSASASEILAGTLQAYRRAVIVGGDHSFGKGSVQSIIDLPNELGAMKVTVGMFFVAGGQSTQHSGVTSDIQFPSVFGSDDIGEKSLDYSLPPQRIASFLSAEANSERVTERWNPIDDDVVKQLSQKSADRVAQNAKFAEITKNLAEARKNEVVKIADLEKKPEKKKDEEGNARDEMKTMVKPMIDESVSIAADLVTSQARGG